MSERARWEALADALATDESLSDDELGFLDELDDELVERERALYATLHEQGEPAPVDPGDRGRAEATLAEFRRRRAVESEPRRGATMGMTAVVALVAVAAVLVLWGGLPTPIVMTLERPDAVVTGGTLMVDEVELGPGDEIPVGRWIEAETDTCVHAGRARGCVASGSRLRVDRDGLSLDDGTLHLWGTTSIQTPEGTIEAVDADLELRVDLDGVVVDAETGTITVRETDGREQVLGARQHHRLGEPPPELPETAEPSEPAVEPIEVPVQAEPATQTGPVTTPKAPRINAASAGDLLSAARRHVASGKVGKALSAYAALRRQYPRSPEAHAANVSIGELELRRGRSKAALSGFDRYLSRGGPLAEEAHWGKIRALHRMGKTDRRDAAIEALRASHPSSVYLARASSL